MLAIQLTTLVNIFIVIYLLYLEIIDDFQDLILATIISMFIVLRNNVPPRTLGAMVTAWEEWGVRVEVQVFKKELHTHIYLDRAEFLFCVCVCVCVCIYIYITMC